MRETINRILLVLMAIGLIIVILYAPLYPLLIVFAVILAIVCIYVLSRPTEANLCSFDGFMLLFIFILLELIDFIIFSLILIFVANIIGG